jgi:hypothetical protein
MTTITPEALRETILAKLTYAVGRDLAHAHDHEMEEKLKSWP